MPLRIGFTNCAVRSTAHACMTSQAWPVVRLVVLSCAALSVPVLRRRTALNHPIREAFEDTCKIESKIKSDIQTRFGGGLLNLGIQTLCQIQALTSGFSALWLRLSDGFDQPFGGRPCLHLREIADLILPVHRVPAKRAQAVNSSIISTFLKLPNQYLLET